MQTEKHFVNDNIKPSSPDSTTSLSQNSAWWLQSIETVNETDLKLEKL